MKPLELLRLFRAYPEKKLFSYADLLQLAGQSGGGVLPALGRLIREGLLDRPARGWYANPFAAPSPEETAMALRAPCYLSLEYALGRTGILSQQAFTLTLVSLRAPHTYRTRQGIFEYHQIARRLFWGFRPLDGVQIAWPEKALLDLIYLRHLRHRTMDVERLASLLEDMYLEDLNPRRLTAFAAGFGESGARMLALAPLRRCLAP